MSKPLKKKITPSMAAQVLERNGIRVTVEQAQRILDFMYFLAKLAIDQSVEK
jgi:hypothetical protein